MAREADESGELGGSLLAALSRPFLVKLPGAGHDLRDPDVALRAQVLVAYTTLAGLTELLYAVTHWMRDSLLPAVLFLAFTGVNALLLVLLRVTGRPALVTHGTLVLAMGSTSLATFLTGGLVLTNVCPFFIIMAAAIFLLGWRGLPWALAAIATPLAFQLAGDRGYPFPNYIPPDGRAADAFITWMVGIVVVLLFALCYEAARVQSLRRRDLAEAARSRFLANVSHELRTPLHAIMGMTQRAQRHELPPTAQEALATVQQNADDLLVLIDDLVQLASMERDRFTLEPADFDPVAVVERVASIMRLRSEELGLAFSLAVSPEAPRWVRGDADRLRQILMNLGSNALKYTDQGSVEVRLEPADVDGDAVGCRFVVTDTGHGIGPVDQARIFERFVRLDAPPTRVHRGVGLGLHIARELVTAMGGHLELDSELGRGSSFAVVVPFAPAETERPAPAAPAPTSAAAGSTLQVLLVDDDSINVRMATLMLDELGHHVSVARSGRQALEQWRAEQPDLILMDIQMPDMDGEEATRRIRQQEQAEGRQPVPIIALTGHGTSHHRDQYLAAGATRCLFKPFRFEELEQAIAAIGAGARVLS